MGRTTCKGDAGNQPVTARSAAPVSNLRPRLNVPGLNDATLGASDSEFKAVGNPAGSVDEHGRLGGRYRASCRFFEKREPAVEVLAFWRQHKMRRQWAPGIVPRSQDHHAPERLQIAEVLGPVLHMLVEDRPQQLVRTHALVEGIYEARDCDLVNLRHAFRLPHV